MKIMCCCIDCRKEYSVKGIHTHYERTHGSKEQQEKYSSGHNNMYHDKEYQEKITEAREKFVNQRYGKIEDYEVECHKCFKNFTVKERSKKFPSKEKYFCSRSCANSKIISDEHRASISQKLKKPIKIKKCLNCSETFKQRGNKKFCSVRCSRKFRSKKQRNNRSLFINYRADCQFKFNLNEYPKEFNFSLIEKYGWYSPKNKKNNLTGVSRDHIVSIKYGFENDIDPNIISHPANCQLLPHSENSSKNFKCGITIEQLKEKIKIWNIKY